LAGEQRRILYSANAIAECLRLHEASLTGFRRWAASSAAATMP
jgi:hypothetical protein